MSLEDIYTKFNIDHPADFTEHSLSVSDVVLLHQDGENTSHYVDSVGYREIPEFTKELSISAEISKEEAPVMDEAASMMWIGWKQGYRRKNRQPPRDDSREDAWERSHDR